MSSPNTPNAQPNEPDLDVTSCATLLIKIVSQNSNLQRGPRNLKAAWEETSRALQDEKDNSALTLFARLGFAAWCVLFIVQNDVHSQRNFQHKADCQSLLQKLSEVSRESRVALAKAVQSTIDDSLQARIDALYDGRIKDTTLGQPGSKRHRAIDVDIWPNKRVAETSPTVATVPSPSVVERPELGLDASGHIPRYSQAKGTFVIKKNPDTRRALSDTTLLEAIVRYPPQTPKDVCDFGVKMFLPKPGMAEACCVMELEINDELAPDYIRELFDQCLKVDERGRYFKSSSGSILRPGNDGIVERCKREASLSVLGSMISTAIRQSPVYQEEAKQCLNFTSCVWAKVSTDVTIKVKLLLCMAIYGGTIMYQQLFHTEDDD